MIRPRRALVSVYDKSELAPLVKTLHQVGCELVSTGGTAKFIRDLGLPCIEVSQLTGFPEILDGRVKTLNPKIFGAILQRGTPQDHVQLTEHQITPIDVVVVNLYPFEQELAKLATKGDPKDQAGVTHMMEYIDIGGVSLLRAAAKNHPCCVVLPKPELYANFIAQISVDGGVSEDYSRRCAARAFGVTAVYDAAISDYFAQITAADKATSSTAVEIKLQKIQTLAYGENPHQLAELYYPQAGEAQGLFPLRQIAGKELSYNNLIDSDGCLGLMLALKDLCACAIVKHSNPCGVGVSPKGDLLEALDNALFGDPEAAFGGIVGFTQKIDADVANRLSKRFIEIIIAPQFSPEAVEILKQKPKLRLLAVDLPQAAMTNTWQIRQTLVGFLRQQTDLVSDNLEEARSVGARPASPQETMAMDLAWRVCRWVKSNAIVIADATKVVGVGAGQMSRVDSVKIALQKSTWKRPGFEGVELGPLALASDAFFPFTDSIELIAAAGVGAIVQPGGSIRDQEVLQAVQQKGLAMLLTGTRHFRH